MMFNCMLARYLFYKEQFKSQYNKIFEKIKGAKGSDVK